MQGAVVFSVALCRLGLIVGVHLVCLGSLTVSRVRVSTERLYCFLGLCSHRVLSTFFFSDILWH